MKGILHITVWILFFVVETQMYWGGRYWMIETFDQAVIYNLITFVPKMLGTYIFLFYFLPRWYAADQRYVPLFFMTLAYLLIWLTIYRWVINFVTWPVAFGVYPRYEPFSIPLSTFSFMKMVTPLGFLVFINSVIDEYKNKHKIQQLEKEKLTAELRFLKAQTNPHFLFNTLNNIYVLARKKSDHTAPAIARLSKLLRYMLYESDQELIPLTKELEIIHDYIDLEKLRYGNRLKVNFKEVVNDQNSTIPPFILLTFVENAFKHGASRSSESFEIKISVEEADGVIEFRCTNPYQKTDEVKDEGIGLKNAARRLQLHYPGNHTLDILGQNNLFDVKLRLFVQHET